jgi:hypothetical protein
MSRLLYNSDPLTGTQHYVQYDSGEDAIHWTSEQDVGPLLEINRAMYNDAPRRWSELEHVAHLPNIIVLKLMREGIWGDSQRLKKFLNDYDFRSLRTRPGNL